MIWTYLMFASYLLAFLAGWGVTLFYLQKLDETVQKWQELLGKQDSLLNDRHQQIRELKKRIANSRKALDGAPLQEQKDEQENKQ